MNEYRFYLSIGDWMCKEEHWFKTEEELKAFVKEKTNGDTIGLDITALEVKRTISC